MALEYRNGKAGRGGDASPQRPEWRGVNKHAPPGPYGGGGGGGGSPSGGGGGSGGGGSATGGGGDGGGGGSGRLSVMGGGANELVDYGAYVRLCREIAPDRAHETGELRQRFDDLGPSNGKVYVQDVRLRMLFEALSRQSAQVRARPARTVPYAPRTSPAGTSHSMSMCTGPVSHAPHTGVRSSKSAFEPNDRRRAGKHTP